MLPVYAPATLIYPGTVDKECEIYLGEFNVYNGKTLFGKVTINNAGEWVKIDLAEEFGNKGFSTDTLTFVKVQGTVNNRYAWGDSSDKASPEISFATYACRKSTFSVSLLGDLPKISR